MRKILYVSIAILVIAWLSMAAFQWARSRGITPAYDVRRAVSGLTASEVKAIIVTQGMTMWPKTITDRESVGLLLAGLKEASYPDPMMKNRVEYVTLELTNGTTIGGPGQFSLSTDREIDAFSPKFVAGLRREGIQVGTRE